MSIKKEIIQVLKTQHGGKWVNPIVALRHPISSHDVQSVFSNLDDLIEGNIVETKMLNIEGNNLPLIRYTDVFWKTKLKMIGE